MHLIKIVSIQFILAKKIVKSTSFSCQEINNKNIKFLFSLSLSLSLNTTLLKRFKFEFTFILVQHTKRSLFSFKENGYIKKAHKNLNSNVLVEYQSFTFTLSLRR